MAGALAGGLVFGAVAVGADTHPAPIEACVNDRTGLVRIVDDPSQCHTNEHPIDWQVQDLLGSSAPTVRTEPTGATVPTGKTESTGSRANPVRLVSTGKTVSMGSRGRGVPATLGSRLSGHPKGSRATANRMPFAS